MADAFFNFDTNIEAVTRRIRTSLTEISQAVARQAASAAGGAGGPDVAQGLERSLQTSIQRANRRLAEIRREFEGALTAGGQQAASPTGKRFQAEAEGVLRDLQRRFASEVGDLGRQFNLPDEQLRRALLEGTAQLTAGFKEIFNTSRRALLDQARGLGLVGKGAERVFGGGLGVDKGVKALGIDPAAFRQEVLARAGSVQVGPQQLREADVGLAGRKTRQEFRQNIAGAFAAGIDPAEAARIINDALRAASKAYADRIKASNAIAAGHGLPAVQPDEGIQRLFQTAVQARANLGPQVASQPLAPSQILPAGVSQELRQELGHLAASSKHAAAEKLREAQASKAAATADEQEAAASRKAAVETSKARAGLTDAQVAKAEVDDLRASRGAYLERRAGVQGSGVIATTPGFIVRGPGETGRVYQATRRALGEGSLLDAEGRVQTLATRVSPEREARLLAEHYAEERLQRARAAAANQAASEKERAARQKLVDRLERESAELELGRAVQARREARPGDFRRIGGLDVDVAQGRVFRSTQSGLGARDVEGPRAAAALAEAAQRDAAARVRQTEQRQQAALKERVAQEKVEAAAREEAHQRARTARLQSELSRGISSRITQDRYLTPRGLEDKRGQRVVDPILEGRARLDRAVAGRLATGQARDLGGGLVFDQSIGRFVQAVNGQAQIIQGAISSDQFRKLNAAVDRLRREAEEASRRVAETAPGGGGRGGRGGVRGTITGGFFEGFNSAGFAGGSGEGNLLENLSRTAGLEARFALTYRALMLLQQGLTDTIQQYREYSSAVTELEIASGGAENVTRDLRNELGDLASLVGENANTAFLTAARGVRSFTDVSAQSSEEVARVAINFAEAAQNLTLLTGQGLQESSNEITAIGQAYGLQADQLNRVNEALAEAKALGGFPDEITTGTSQFAVAAAEAGIGLRETMALISTITAQTGQSGAAVGTRLSRVVNTLRGSTGRNLLSGLGIDTGQLPIDQLRELADIYDRLGEADQRNVASQLSGVANIREFTVLLRELQSGSRTSQVVDLGLEEGGQSLEEQMRLLGSTSGQIGQLVGQFKELQDALIQSGVFDVIGITVAAMRPLLELTNDLFDAFNAIPKPLRSIIVLLAQFTLLSRGLAALRASGALGVGVELPSIQAATAAKRAEASITQLLLVVERELATFRAQAAGVTDVETAAINRQTTALEANAAAARTAGAASIGATGFPVAGTATSGLVGANAIGAAGRTQTNLLRGVDRGGVLARGRDFTRSVTGTFAPALGRASTAVSNFASTTGGAVTIIAGVAILVNEIRQQFVETLNALEANKAAQQTAASSFRTGDFEGGIDALRNQAAASEEAARGGRFKNALASGFGLVGIADVLTRRRAGQEAEELRERATNAEARRRRQEEIDATAAAQGSASVFGLTVSGTTDIEQGIAQLREAGTNATRIFDELANALDRTVAAGQLAEAEFSVLPGGLEQLAATLAEQAVGLRSAAIRQERSGSSGYTVLEELANAARGGRTKGYSDEQLEVDTGRLGLDPEQEQEMNQAVYDAAILALQTQGITSLEGGALTSEQITDIAEKLADAYVPAEGESEEETQRIKAELVSVYERALAGLTDFSGRDFTQAEANIFAQFAAQSAQVFESTEKLGGATETAAAQSSLDRLRRAASIIEESGEVVSDVLVTAIEEAERHLQDVRSAVQTARVGYEIATTDPADVAGRSRDQRNDLVRQLQIARDRNEEEKEYSLLAQIAELDRSAIEAARNRLSAEERVSFDPRDESGRLGAELDAAIRELEATPQFDAFGDQTEAYSNALDRVQGLQIQQAQKAAELAAASTRAGLDPRDELGNAQADLDEALAILDLQLEGTVEFYEAQRKVAEAQQALIQVQADTAAAAARAGVDPRDELTNAALDIEEAKAALARELPKSRAYYERLRELQEAQIALTDLLLEKRAAQRLAGVEPGDELGRVRAQVTNLREQLNAALPDSTEYYQLLIELNGLNAEAAEIERATKAASRRAGIDSRDTVGDAVASVEDARDALEAAVPNTAEYFEAIRNLADAQQALAEEQRNLANARDLANVAPGDSLGEAEAALRAARRRLSDELPGTIGFYEALREVREAEQSIADERRRLAEAEALSTVTPGDEVGEARVQLRIAEQRLRDAVRGTVEFYEALRAVNEAKKALAEAENALADARDLAGLDPRDDIGRARAEVRAAERALRIAVRGTREFYEAVAALKEAEQGLVDAIRARDDARTLSRVFPGSSIQQATADIEIARRALEDALRDTAEYYQALGALRDAQVALAQAQAEARSTERLLNIDITNPIAKAQAQLEGLRDMFDTLKKLGAPSDVLNGILLDIKEAEAALQETVFNERLGALRDLVDIGAISEEQFITYLEAEKQRLLSIQNRTYAQNQQLIEIEKALQAANEEASGQFNIGDIRAPSVFEVRRALANAAPGLTEIENAFGTGSNRDPIGILVNGATSAVHDLAYEVDQFGNLVESVLGALGLSIDSQGNISGGGNLPYTGGSGPGGSGVIYTGGPATATTGGGGGGGGGSTYTSPSPPASTLPTTNAGLVEPWPTATLAPGTTFSQTSTSQVSIEINGADMAAVTRVLDRYLGPTAMSTRSATGRRKF